MSMFNIDKMEMLSFDKISLFNINNKIRMFVLISANNTLMFNNHQHLPINSCSISMKYSSLILIPFNVREDKYRKFQYFISIITKFIQVPTISIIPV